MLWPKLVCSCFLLRFFSVPLPRKLCVKYYAVSHQLVASGVSRSSAGRGNEAQVHRLHACSLGKHDSRYGQRRQETVSQGNTFIGQGYKSERSTLKPSSLASVKVNKRENPVRHGVKVVVLTLTLNTMRSVVAGQAPITLGWWKKYLK